MLLKQPNELTLTHKKWPENEKAESRKNWLKLWLRLWWLLSYHTPTKATSKPKMSAATSVDQHKWNMGNLCVSFMYMDVLCFRLLAIFLSCCRLYETFKVDDDVTVRRLMVMTMAAAYLCGWIAIFIVLSLVNIYSLCCRPSDGGHNGDRNNVGLLWISKIAFAF